MKKGGARAPRGGPVAGWTGNAVWEAGQGLAALATRTIDVPDLASSRGTEAPARPKGQGSSCDAELSE